MMWEPFSFSQGSDDGGMASCMLAYLHTCMLPGWLAGWLVSLAHARTHARRYPRAFLQGRRVRDVVDMMIRLL